MEEPMSIGVEMPSTIVRDPDINEERRQLAEVINRLYYIMGVIVSHANEFVPGDLVEKLQFAWNESHQNIANLVLELNKQYPTRDEGLISNASLEKNGLTKKSGALKRSWLGRLEDSFLVFFDIIPRTPEDTKNAARAARDCLEGGESVVESLAEFVPYHHQVKELISLIRQAVRMKWGD
jgi:hypothetical protein